MIRANAEFLGILPSLEVLPFFARDSDDPCGGTAFPFRLKAYSSYGEISRDMLTRRLMGGIIPWEIFISDVLALPGQRADWKVLLFLHACPTELVLREPIHKAFYPAQSNARNKLPTRLTIGVESQNSLTKAQSREWLNHWKNSRSIELTFRMLPMDLMIQALEAEALDAIIAPSPWGIHAEATGLGKRDPRFTPGKFAQQLVMICHRDFLEMHPSLSQSSAKIIADARSRLRKPAVFTNAISQLMECGKPSVYPGILEQAATVHSFTNLNQDVVPDIAKLVSELMSLDDFAVLPAQVAPSEQTARLLLPS
jgi:NMT1-like family